MRIHDQILGGLASAFPSMARTLGAAGVVGTVRRASLADARASALPYDDVAAGEDLAESLAGQRVRRGGRPGPQPVAALLISISCTIRTRRFWLFGAFAHVSPISRPALPSRDHHSRAALTPPHRHLTVSPLHG